MLLRRVAGMLPPPGGSSPPLFGAPPNPLKLNFAPGSCQLDPKGASMGGPLGPSLESARVGGGVTVRARWDGGFAADGPRGSSYWARVAWMAESPTGARDGDEGHCVEFVPEAYGECACGGTGCWEDGGCPARDEFQPCSRMSAEVWRRERLAGGEAEDDELARGCCCGGPGGWGGACCGVRADDGE